MEKKITIEIRGMHCASCAANIETRLSQLKGIKKASVDFSTNKALVIFDSKLIDEKRIKTEIENLGYKAIFPELEKFDEKSERKEIIKQLLIFLFGLSFTIPTLYISIFSYSMEKNILLFLLATPVQIILGYRFYRGAWYSLKNRFLNMDVLVALSSSSAFIYSMFATFIFEGHVFYDVSTSLLTIIYFGKFLEDLIRKRASEAIRKLISLKPKTATLIKNGKEIQVSVEEINVGDIVLVKPGESIPVDGVIIEGFSSIDESMITGESIPKDKKVGDKVFAGTINKFGAIKIKAERVGKDTLLEQIIRLVEESLSSKTNLQRIADRVVNYFVPTVLLIAFVSFSVWYFLLNTSFLFALTVFVAVLAIACPCGLGLATPMALIVGIGNAAKKGILIREASKLEILPKANVIVLDKTGTLTKGIPKVVKVTNKKTLELAAIAEKNSEHPISKAIIEEAKRRKIKIVDPSYFEAIPGKGVIAKLKNKEIIVGNVNLMKDYRINIKKFEKEIFSMQEKGITPIIVALNKKVVGIIGVADTLKEHSKEAVNKFKEMGLEVIMLTGDNENVAKSVAKELGIEKYYAEVLPNEKVEIIKNLQKNGKIVIMVGDGINDAPSLSQSDIGIAMGSGSDIAKYSGDIILIKDDLRDVVYVIELSKKVVNKIKQNLFWAFFYNSSAIPIAAGVLYPFFGIFISPTLCAALMIFSSISVVLNSLLLRKV
ncbi:MAG: heavy metal translocating P-type ATPase [Candidatus Aenigmatarchaeota archaeon]